MAADDKKEIKEAPQRVESREMPRNDAVIITQENFSGPLPRPDILAGYEKILPGAANRIVSMAENQSAHRHSLENWVVRADAIRSLGGLVCAFLIVIAAMGIGTYLTIQGKPVTGIIVALGSLGTIVAAFLYTNTNKVAKEKKDRDSEETN
ncbi:DUF2335 domain-containing protein [Acetobacteraceae bacterium]|nr:DUF2335 domain-containing protein [Candidatus Parcubacteria bacterium]